MSAAVHTCGVCAPFPPGGDMFKDASEALTFIEKENVALVDVRFCDLPGVMQHFTIPVATFKRTDDHCSGKDKPAL